RPGKQRLTKEERQGNRRKRQENRVSELKKQGVFNHIDWITLGIFAALLICSLIILNSASSKVIEDQPHYYFNKQALFMLLGAGLMTAVAFIDYRRYREYAGKGYIAILILLGLVLIFGTGDGSKRWLFGFQPSEVAKIVMIVVYASWLTNHRDELHEAKVVWKSMLFMAVPMGLIFVEPDLGTSLVFLVIMLVMLFVSGANRKVFYGFCLGLLAAIVIIYISLYIYTDGFTKLLEEKIPFLPLKPYQLMRLAIFINPEMDPQNSGFHIIQSMIAVGSGGLLGKGYGNGTQVQSGFLPEHHTDFIFSVAGEEMGFLFCTFVLILYMVFLIRLMRTAYIARDFFGTLIVTGICSMLIFQVLVNVGMTMGIMPITGLPLPFFSYGISSLWTNMMAVGLVFSISLRGRKQK
ncbi:MAG: rod shape-determining protein RodA, partial [Bacillota bacterium]|nr:rod shape-determining protein RodA [Bacillota bacterium]